MAELQSLSVGGFGMNVQSNTYKPTVKGLNTAGSWSYQTQNGFYYRIGKLVFVSMTIAFTKTSSTAAGELYISLPFAVDSSCAGAGASLGYTTSTNTTTNTYIRKARYAQFQRGTDNKGWATLRMETDDNTVIASNVTQIQTNAQVTIQLTGVYVTDE